MKKFTIILITLALTVSLAACGGGKEKNADTSNTKTETQTEKKTDEGTPKQQENKEAPEKGDIAAKGATCTITVPKPETFIDGYKITDAGCNDSKAVQIAYVKLSKEDPMIDISVSIKQLTVSSAETQDAKGYAEYCNNKNLGPYEPVEIAGYQGYLKAKFSNSTKLSDNWYILDYPLPDGTSMVIDLYVGQKYADNTSAVAPIAEAFLKNIEVAPNNG